LGDRILVRKSTKETMTPGGILLPSDNVKESNEGVVVAVGPGIRDVNGILHPVNLKSGENVLLPKYGGTEVEIGDEPFDRVLGDVADRGEIRSLVLVRVLSLVRVVVERRPHPGEHVRVVEVEVVIVDLALGAEREDGVPRSRGRRDRRGRRRGGTPIPAAAQL
jgi:chaperonin GroES